jgi:anti-anti-sigma regulatory factor
MATPGVGVTTSTRTPAKVPGRVGSEEYHSTTLPSSHEAALLYAANMADAAQRLLKAEIKDPVGRANKQAWLMLFDLFQITQNREEYDSISMLFTVKFEQSPPAWIERGDDEQGDPRRTQSRERKDFYAFKPGPDGELAADIAKFVAFAEAQGTVRLDVSKVTAISPADATLLAGALAKLRRSKLPMWFNNLEALQGVLRAAFNEKTASEQKPYWTLLFETYILQGNTEAFEELSLEYAVAFEVSPPNWEVYINTVAAAVAKAAPAAALPAVAAPDAGFEMKGVLSAASANQVAELNAHAASRSEVVVDMGKVMRVEFGYTSAFFDVVKAIQLAGKRVILTNLNEVNAALLEALGVNRYAILVRRKST